MAVVTAERRRRRPRVFFGWFVVIGGIGIQALQGALLNSSYGAYVVLLQRDFGWSKTVFSSAYSLQQVEQGIVGPMQGWLIDRFGARMVMRIGIAVFGAGFVLFSRFHSIWTFLLAMMVMSFGASMGGFLSVSATLVHWFVRRRSTVFGLMSTGLGIGGLPAPVVTWSLTQYGWRTTAFVSGLLVMLIGLPLTQLMRHSPERRLGGEGRPTLTPTGRVPTITLAARFRPATRPAA